MDILGFLHSLALPTGILIHAQMYLFQIIIVSVQCTGYRRSPSYFISSAYDHKSSAYLCIRFILQRIRVPAAISFSHTKEFPCINTDSVLLPEVIWYRISLFNVTPFGQCRLSCLFDCLLHYCDTARPCCSPYYSDHSLRTYPAILPECL